MKRIAIFASGGGTNMEAIMEYLSQMGEEQSVEVVCVISDNPDAYVLQRAKKWKVRHYALSAHELADAPFMLTLLRMHQVDAIVLAGYLKLIPQFMLEAYPDRIVNIHPALLPKYGGKGMYGMKVHEAVKEAGERETGITIHVIDDEYDKGTMLFQATTPINPDDTPEEIAEKVHALEHEHYPRVIVEWLSNL